MRREPLAGALVSAMLLLACGTRAGTPKIASILASPAAAKPGAVFAQDKGTFRILVNGQQVGKEEFEISSRGGDWVAHDTSEIQGAKGTSRITGTLELYPDGTPAHYEWSTQGEKKASATIGFEGSTATIDLHIEGVKPYTQQFTFNSPQVVILDNNLYYQYAVLASLYDWNRKGAQTFAVLVPQELTPGSVTVESAGTHDANGKKLEELAVKSPDLEVDLFLDGQRLVRIVSPSTNAEILRDK
ncbi:MAG: hypothetical protein ACRD3B_04270 [Candidatus Sulfotelmatobacter sp.]